MRYLFPLLLLIGSLPVTAASTQQGLYYAEVCFETSHESTVLVRRLNEAICTGTLIRSDVVLTAAHCITDTPNSPPKASKLVVSRVPRAASANSYNQVHVKRFEMHPQYARDHATDNPFTTNHDIALLFLEEHMLLIPAQLPTKEMTEGRTVRQEGFGRDEDGVSGVLHCRSNKVRETADAHGLLVDGACFGDSGGPVYADDGTVYGVAAFFDGFQLTTHPCDIPVWYTSVYAHLNWIAYNMKSQKPPPPVFGCGG